MADTNGKKASGGRKPPVKPNPLVQAAQQTHAAEEELRPLVALWVAVMRNRITALKQEFWAVNNAAKDGSVLARVIDAVAVNDVYVDLSNADNEACSLAILGDELPVPDLLGALAKPIA